MATLPEVLINPADIKSAGVLHFVSELRCAEAAVPISSRMLAAEAMSLASRSLICAGVPPGKWVEFAAQSPASDQGDVCQPSTLRMVI
jgi:hypothetical protein